MKYFLLLICLLALPACTYAQRVANPRLKHELDSLYRLDQLYRKAMFADKKQHVVDSLATALHLPVTEVQQKLVSLMQAADSSDMRRVRAIIQRYGYPGKTLVGTPTNKAAFYVIQHSNSIPRYLPLIKQAADKGELPFRLYAMMLDRHLINMGKPQLYGTQGFGYNGQPPFIWPIEDPAHVNERRQKAGFDLSVEQDAQRMNIPYHVLTIEQVRQMPGYQPPAH
jgi:hypothetical protein